MILEIPHLGNCFTHLASWKLLFYGWYFFLKVTLFSNFKHPPISSKVFSPSSISSVTQSCLTLSDPFTNSQNLLKLMSIGSVMPSNHLILCHPLLLLPSVFLSIRIFSNELALHIRWPKCWTFSFSTSPSHEYSGLISLRMDCLELLAVQGTLKSLLQHHTSKASIFLLRYLNHYKSSLHDLTEKDSRLKVELLERNLLLWMPEALRECEP